MSEHQTGGSKSISAFIFTSSGPFKGVISWCNRSWCLFHSAFIIFYYFSLALGLYFAIVQANLRYGMEGFIYVCAHTLLWDISPSTSWTGGSTTDCLMDWFNECISNEVAETAAWRQFDKWTSRKQISPPSLTSEASTDLSCWRTDVKTLVHIRREDSWVLLYIVPAYQNSLLCDFCSNQTDAVLYKRSKCLILTLRIVSSTAKMLLFSVLVRFWLK